LAIREKYGSNAGMRNSFDRFKELPDRLQDEAIREGEKLLEAQLAVATAADQRALTWGGFLLTGATAAFGGGVALFNNGPADPLLGYTAILFGVALLWAAWLSLMPVAPSLFCFPGNRPGLWLPDQWDCTGDESEKIEKARVDQAQQLDKFIRNNMKDAEKRAKEMRRSFQLAFGAVLAAGLFLLITVTARQFAICGAISEIFGLQLETH